MRIYSKASEGLFWQGRFNLWAGGPLSRWMLPIIPTQQTISFYSQNCRLLTYHSIVRWIPRRRPAGGSASPLSCPRLARKNFACLWEARKWKNSGWAGYSFRRPLGLGLRPAHLLTRLRTWRGHKKAAYHLCESPAKQSHYLLNDE